MEQRGIRATSGILGIKKVRSPSPAFKFFDGLNEAELLDAGNPQLKEGIRTILGFKQIVAFCDMANAYRLIFGLPYSPFRNETLPELNSRWQIELLEPATTCHRKEILIEPNQPTIRSEHGLVRLSIRNPLTEARPLFCFALKHLISQQEYLPG